MSEYQYYEFVAIDRPLTAKEIAELRKISSRAEISPTRFSNEYQWGDFKGDPAKLLLRYFDVHLYFANWGTRRFMLRLPARSVDVAALEPYFGGVGGALSVQGEFVVLDFLSESEEGDGEWTGEGLLAALIPLRAQIQQGDLRAVYIGWLAGVQSSEVEEDDREPPVPAGLAELSAPLASLAEFLRVDDDLIAAAAEASAAPQDDTEELRAWVEALPVAEKDRWLRQAVELPEVALGAELRAAFRKGRPQGEAPEGRTAGALLARAEEIGASRR